MEDLRTYKFFTPKGQRLSVFGKLNEAEDALIITYFPCSRDEQFSKKDAKQAYEKGFITRWSKKDTGIKDEKGKTKWLLIEKDVEVKKTVISIPLQENIHFKKQFIEFCRDSFLMKGKTKIEIEVEYLYNRNEYEMYAD
jgi:hypothetical protein